MDKYVAFRHETDGQTERINKYVESILRAFINPQQSNWDILLPLVEFSINNAYQVSIKTSPFFINFGQHPKTPTDNAIVMRGASKDERIEAIQLVLARAKDCIAASQVNMAQLENRQARSKFQCWWFCLVEFS